MDMGKVEIEDVRANSSWAPAVSILETFMPKIDPKYFVGIRKIVLLDKDYHRDKRVQATGRYIPIEGTRGGDIELYLEYLSELPDEAKNSRMYLTYRILKTLAHELYHHRVRGQRIERRPKFEQEQKRADQWAAKIVKPIFAEVFPREKYESEWVLIQQKLTESRKGGESDSKVR